MGAVVSKRRRAGAGAGAGAARHQEQQHDTTPERPTLVVGLGDPMLDLILADVPPERLRELGIERGGCVQVPSARIDALLDALATPPPPPGDGNAQSHHPHAVRPEGLPGGSAANVIKGLAGLARATGADNAGGMRCRFAGMVARDGAGERYASALAAEGVEPVLLVGGGAAADGSEDDQDNDEDAGATARCLCLVTPDGERTMRTCLGAAERLRSEARQLAPRRWLDPPPSSSHPDENKQQPHRLLVHLEGYALYRPELAAGALRAARAKKGRTSLDLASFELVRARHALLLALLAEGLVDCLFCNEDEARALAEAAGLLGEGEERGAAAADDGGLASDDEAGDRWARAAAAKEAAAAAAAAAKKGGDDLPSMCPAAAAAQRYLVEKGAGLCVVSLGARGCTALARRRKDNEARNRGESAAAVASTAPAPATTTTTAPAQEIERAGARACALRSPLVDTVGAGDTFTAGFLFAWLRGKPLARCCALACAAGAEVVQVAGASLGAEGWARAWQAGGGVDGDGGLGGGGVGSSPSSVAAGGVLAAAGAVA